MSEKKIKKKLKRSNGHVIVARGMGGEGSVGCVANGHMTVGRWGKGGGGGGGGGVEPAQHKARGLATGLKKIEIRLVGWPRTLKKIEIWPGSTR